MKDFHALYRTQGPYHHTATGFRSWFLRDNYMAIGRHCRPSDSVLDLACGEGCLGAHLDVARLAGVDYSPDALDFNRQLHPGVYNRLHLGDMRALEAVRFGPDRFSVVVCSLSLMYLGPDELVRCVTHVRELLDPGGSFICTYPTAGAQRPASDHAIELTPEELDRRL